MKFSTLIALLLLLLTSGAIAQNSGKITGSVQQTNKPAEAATISLLRAKDSATVKLSVSNKEGAYSFENIALGKYLIGVTAVGFQKAYSAPFEIGESQLNVTVPQLNLLSAAKAMNEVSVTAKRALVEQRIDRTIVNVDASITNTGTSALEVLEKAPGVSVDREGNISLKGKSGVMVMVDGRPTQMGGADLANLLRSMNSAQLDQIEIMTNPPARYDAAGTSGVINIKTKKVDKAGFNGSANLTYTQGRYAKTAENFNFNYRQGKINLFTSLSHNYNKRFATMRIDRNIFDANTGDVQRIFNQETNRVMEGNAYSARVGADFFVTDKTIIGAVVNVGWREATIISPNTTFISTATKDLESITRADVNNKMDWSSISANFNLRRAINKKGREFTADLDVARHRMEGGLFMVNSFTDAGGFPYQKADTLTGLLPQQIDVYSARADYVHPLNKGFKFEAGIKSSYVKTDNDARYDSIQFGRTIPDRFRSNHFVYEENINALYTNFTAPLSKKWTAQLGLRLENTIAEGRQLTTGQTFNRNYTQLFPTAYFQYKANEKNSFVANFGRRISRPSYQSLNPFIRFIDRYTFSQGNPDLLPSISNNVELSHTWKNKITTTLNYTHVMDIIEEVIQQKGQEAYNMPSNVAALYQFGIAINANTPLTKWWTSNISINASRDNYKGFIGGTPIDLVATSMMINFTQQFKISKTLAAEINGRYRTGWLEGVMRIQPLSFFGLGLSKQVLKNQGSIRLSVRDIFWTQRQKGRAQYSNVDVQMNQFAETRVASLGFTYNFSKGKKIAPVKRTAGSANEEQGRIGQ